MQDSLAYTINQRQCSPNSVTFTNVMDITVSVRNIYTYKECEHARTESTGWRRKGGRVALVSTTKRRLPNIVAALHIHASFRLVGGVSPVPLLVIVETAQRNPYDHTTLPEVESSPSALKMLHAPKVTIHAHEPGGALEMLQ